MTGAESASKQARIVTRFFPVSAALRPYCSIIYLTEIDAPPGVRVEDYLHPEWANMRFIDGEIPSAAIGGATPAPAPRFIAAGPTSQACYFAAGTMRAWGIGILPMGWAKFFAAPAENFADRFHDGEQHPAFAAVAPLAERLRSVRDAESAAKMIDDHFAALLAATIPRSSPRIARSSTTT
ncbi:MAG TPA: hypothetical protein PKC32_11865 [Sphingopyxis sp.]|nr:hypothetical protein [Sphingopyxis sp.]